MIHILWNKSKWWGRWININPSHSYLNVRRICTKKMKNNFCEISTVINSYMYMCVYSTCVAECRSYRCPSSSPIRFTHEWVIHSLLLFSLFHSFHSRWFWDRNWPLNWRLIFLIWYRGFKLMIVGLLQKRRMMKMSKFENKTWQMPHFSTLSPSTFFIHIEFFRHFFILRCNDLNW